MYTCTVIWSVPCQFCLQQSLNNGASSLPVESSSMGHHDGAAAGSTCPVGRSCTCTGCPCCSTASSGASSAPPSSLHMPNHTGNMRSLLRRNCKRKVRHYLFTDTGGASSGETMSVSFHIMSNSLLLQFIVLLFSIVELFTTLNHNLRKILTELWKEFDNCKL